MAIHSSIQLSQLEYGRIDADFYQPIYLNELHHWDKLKETVGVAKLSRLIKVPVRTGRTPSLRTINKEDEIVSFVKTDTLREGYIDFTKSADLPLRVLTASDFISPNSVIVTIIGATPEIVGRAAIVRDSDPACVTNQNVAVITTNQKCDPYFLTAYLQTKYGRDQLWRHSRRTEQVNLNCREVERILVPNPPIHIQEEIGGFVRKSFDASDKYEIVFNDAKQLFESELGFDKLNSNKLDGYAVRFSTTALSDIFKANRIDAQCFAPKAILYVDWLLKNTQCDQLGRLLDHTFKGRQQIEVVNGAIDYCSIKHINGRELTNTSKCNPTQDAPLAFTNDLLLAITGATIGKIGIIKRYSQLAFSGDLLRMRANENINPHYLLFVLDHLIGQVQFNRWITGSTNGHLAPRDIRHILVPRLKQGIEKRIASLVEESLAKRMESELLLEQAKTRVEQLIESAVQG